MSALGRQQMVPPKESLVCKLEGIIFIYLVHLFVLKVGLFVWVQVCMCACVFVDTPVRVPASRRGCQVSLPTLSTSSFEAGSLPESGAQFL